MTELRIIRGRDIEVCADGEQLFGITELSASEERGYHEIHEYLTGVPTARLREKTAYNISLTMLAMFHSDTLEQDGFVLSIRDGDIQYRYTGCRLIQRKSNIKADRRVSETYLIRADGMTKRVINHAGA